MRLAALNLGSHPKVGTCLLSADANSLIQIARTSRTCQIVLAIERNGHQNIRDRVGRKKSERRSGSPILRNQEKAKYQQQNCPQSVDNRSCSESDDTQTL